MSQGAIVMLVVAIAVIAAAVALALALSRRSKLRALPAESREKYANSWRNVENRFIEDPTAAVGEADRMVVLMLSERGATLDDPRTVPADMRKARDAAASGSGAQGTEGMRLAMVHYRHIVDESVGTDRTRREGYRREVAS